MASALPVAYIPDELLPPFCSHSLPEKPPSLNFEILAKYEEEIPWLLIYTR